jgi:hypothetical protein
LKVLAGKVDASALGKRARLADKFAATAFGRGRHG